MDRKSRRAFLAAAASLGLGASPGRSLAAVPAGADRPLGDLHVHLFGTGDGGSGCRISRKVSRSLLFLALQAIYRPRRAGKTFDEGYVEVLMQEVASSGLAAVGLFAQDGVYDGAGRLDERATHVYVPNDHLFRVAARWPDVLVPCVSINPDRRDALDELERCAARGSRLCKVHPPIQGVDIAEPRHRRFFSRCAELDVTVLVHTGHEHSAPICDVGLADPRKLEPALEEGCTVVACHCGTGWRGEKPDFLPGFLSLARRHPRLWGDTAVLGSARRVADVERLLAEEDLLPRLLHGSDFPFPSTPLAFAGRLGVMAALRLQAARNPLRRDLLLKVALGFGRESAERAHRFLSAGRSG